MKPQVIEDLIVSLKNMVNLAEDNYIVHPDWLEEIKKAKVVLSKAGVKV